MAKKSSVIEDKIYAELGINPSDYLNNIVMAKDYATYSISPRIDPTCGGGIKEGSLVLIEGPEKLGKTTLALTIGASAQNHDKNKRKLIYIDTENRLQERDLKYLDYLLIVMFFILLVLQN